MKEFAPAKINLNLHVVGKRADGYHLLDSLVVFVSTGDELQAWPSEEISLYLRGPFARELSKCSPSDNLVIKAANMLRDAAHIKQGARIELIKNLPLASGIGGGSSDAAAALRLLAKLWQVPDDVLPSLAEKLGSDVPACLRSCSLRMQGVGRKITPLNLPHVGWFVLVNPGVEVGTPEVFSRFDGRFSEPLQGDWQDKSVKYFRHVLNESRNDLEPAAIMLAPVISTVLAALVTTSGSKLSRMSGSGATCFALFDTPLEAQNAARKLKQQYPEWWVAAAELYEYAHQA